MRGLSLEEAPPPAADAFGNAMRSPLRLTVPGDGSEIRVPLASEDLPATLSYDATPALELTAFMTATIQNTRALPTGNATIYVGDAYVADTAIAANQDGKVVLPLGADPDVRLTRKVMPSSQTEGVFSKDDVTSYRVVIEVGNYKKRPISLRLTEPLPKSGNEKIKVDLLSSSPKHKDAPADRGVVIWALNVPAGKTQTVELVYRVSRPSDFQVWTR
jgi:uncharacterized protein (TIGR02231 family)